MLEMLIYALLWCFAIYGMLVMIQEILKVTSYDEIKENVKLILFSFYLIYFMLLFYFLLLL